MGQCTAGTKYHWDSVPLGQFTAGAGTKYIYRAAANSKMFDVQNGTELPSPPDTYYPRGAVCALDKLKENQYIFI